jgi:hypothetical protein
MDWLTNLLKPANLVVFVMTIVVTAFSFEAAMYLPGRVVRVLAILLGLAAMTGGLLYLTAH